MSGATPGGTSLSVCCLTRGPTLRVAEQLRLLRGVADEIVVGLDTSVATELAHPLAALADVIVRYPYADPVDRPVGWIHSLCTCDWILWIDDDEIPSASLVGSVRETIADPSVTHCFVPRRTLWRDEGSALVGPPWVPDYQLRLVRNDPAVLWFPGITHWPVNAVGSHRYLEAPLYHTDLLLSPVERRRAKVRRYETAIPGRRVAGLPMNDAYFLPEDRDEVHVAPIDRADRGTVARILALDPSPAPGRSAAALRTATREEIDAHWHGAPATDDLYRGELGLVGDVAPFAVGEQRGVVVRVENRGTHVWPPGSLGWPAVRVGYRWRDDGGTVAVSEGLRTPLPAALAPGESLLLPVDVAAPPAAGPHALVLDLLHEDVRWFGCELSVPVHVRPALCVAILGEDDEAATAAAAALAEVAPSVRPLVLAQAPEQVTALHGYPAAPDTRSYVLEGDGARGRVRATTVALARAAALVGDAALRRAGRRRRLAATRSPFIAALQEADALLVVGDACLRGSRGEREALQQRAATLAARALGLQVVVVPRAADRLAAEVAGAVRRIAVRDA